MLESLKNLLKKFRAKDEPLPARDLRSTGAHTAPPKVTPKQAVPRKDPEYVQADDKLTGDIDNIGPGKNVLIRNKFIREDTGTHETLKILDDSLIDSGEEQGIDPYNTGNFDRSKNWDSRRGK